MEIKNLNLIPEGDKPVIHASQFDENRVIRFDLKDGTEDYTLLSGLVVTCNIKKVDGNIVSFAVENTESTYVEITLPLQATTCAGLNIGEIVISATSGEDNITIGTINFILEVEKSPMLGGIESASDIHDLEEQIEVIVTQVIATDYYTKTEVDNLLNEKADISDLPDMDNYYNKTQVDNKLDQKADITDLPDMTDYYTKTAVDNLLNDKADISDLPDMSNYYNKTQVDNMFLDIMPVNTLSGDIVSFNTSIVRPFESITVDSLATKIYRRGINLWDEQWELGSYDVNGQPIVSINTIRTLNYIIVKPNTTYFFKNSTSEGYMYEYDFNKSYANTRRTVNNNTFTTGANTYYIRFRMASSYGTTYNNDISINYPSTDTQYHAYNTNSADFNVSEIDTISPIMGDNVFFADSGDIDISFKQDIQNYVDSKISDVNVNRTLSMIRPVNTEESKGDEDER